MAGTAKGGRGSEPLAVRGARDVEELRQFAKAAPGLVLDLERIASSFHFERRLLALPVEDWRDMRQQTEAARVRGSRAGRAGNARHLTTEEARRAHDDTIPSQERFIATFAQRFAAFERLFGEFELELAAIADVADNCYASATARFVSAARTTLQVHARFGKVPDPRDFPGWDWGGLRASVTRECARVLMGASVAMQDLKPKTPPTIDVASDAVCCNIRRALSQSSEVRQHGLRLKALVAQCGGDQHRTTIKNRLKLMHDVMQPCRGVYRLCDPGASPSRRG